MPQLAGVAKSKKARTGSVNPRPHTTAPKSGVGTLQSRQPHAAKSRSKPATVPQLAPTAFGKSQGKRVTTKKTRKQVIEETMEGQQDLGVMFGGSAATAKARANPNVRMTMRGRQDAGINCETRRGGEKTFQSSCLRGMLSSRSSGAALARLKMVSTSFSCRKNYCYGGRRLTSSIRHRLTISTRTCFVIFTTRGTQIKRMLPKTPPTLWQLS